MSCDPDFLPFSAWMERALFDPERGYYSARVQTVGRHGDFSTSATISDLLGDAIAHWLMQELKRQPQIRNVIELGGGDGSLSKSVRKRLGWWQRLRLRWSMVEISPRLREQQQAKLGSRNAHWFTDLAEALKSCDGQALIFHNELVDAFPVTLLQWNASLETWQEVWLQKTKSGWNEVLQTFAPDESTTFCAGLDKEDWKNVPLRDGQRMDVHRSYRDWLQTWSPGWKAGAMLTIDYGDTFPQLYYRQPRGNLRAYLRHQTLTGKDVYANMGRQDLTTDVNFSDLEAWGTALGWKNEALQTQAQFLQTCLPDLEKRIEKAPSAAFLTNEFGAGSAFKVLVQRPACPQ